MALNLDTIQESDNLTPLMEKDELAKIAGMVVKGYEIDEESRAGWQATIEPAMKIAKQVVEPKSYPWPGSSNIKFPLITEAAIDFAARVMPEIIQNDRVVKAKITGNDPDGSKDIRSQRVTSCMNYQLLYQNDEWETGMDKTLQCLAVLGIMFKKTYYNPLERRNVSEMCAPDRIVVNYATSSLETARRITHRVTVYANDIIEKQRDGVYNNDVNVDHLMPAEYADMQDEDHPIELLEQHCYLDLDEDGYKEPYIVTVHKPSGEVLRIVERFEKVERNKDGEVKRITPCQYFTDYHFIHSPDGGYYSMGYGQLLLPLNKAINTVFNQLIDAGTLSNTQGGLIGKGLRLKNGDFKVRMNEWKVVDSASGTDLGKNIFPFPVKEPSQTLFQLLQMLIQVGKDLTSSTDALQGKQQVQNVSNGAMNQMVEQGGKIFDAIHKRIYRSLQNEYQKLYYLNYKHLSNKEYRRILDDDTANVKADFDLESMDITPVADPTMSSSNQKFMRAQAVQGLRSVDVRAADQYTLEALQLDSGVIKKLLPEQDPNAPPPPEAQKIQAEIQLLQAQVAQISASATLAAEQNAMKNAEMQQSMRESESRINESMARVVKMSKDIAHGDAKMIITSEKMQSEQQIKRLLAENQGQKDQTNAFLTANDQHNKRNKDDVNAALEMARLEMEKEQMGKEKKGNEDEGEDN